MRRWIKAACLCLLAAFALTACDGNSKDGANGRDHRRNRGVASRGDMGADARRGKDDERNRGAASSDDIGADARRSKSGDASLGNRAVAKTSPKNANVPAETTSRSFAASNEREETKTPSEGSDEKAAVSTSTPEANNGEETTTLKKKAPAAGETSDEESLTSSEGKKNVDIDSLIAKLKATDGKYSTEPLDPNATRLPPEYLGHDVEATVERVEEIFESGNVEKSEYEKTSEYRKRLETFKSELAKKALYGNLTFDSTLALAFTQGGESSISADCEYDADAERFTVSFGGYAPYDVDMSNDYSGNYYGFRFCRELLQSDEYVGVNGFGVEKKIEKEIYFSCGIVYTDSRGLRISYGDEIRLKNVPPAQAQEIGEALSVLCVFKLMCLEEKESEKPGIRSYIHGGHLLEPTMSFPYEMFDSMYAVCTTIPEFWLYNYKTGEVYAKYSLKDVKNNVAKSIGEVNLKKTENAAGKENSADSEESAEEQAAREAARSATQVAKERRRSAAFWQEGNRRLENRLDAVKKLKPSRELDAPTSIAVPENCATLQEALAEAAKAPYSGPIPRVALAAGEYDASGLVLKTSVDIQSATGNPADVVLKVDAASPIVVDGETVVEFDGATLRQVGSGEKAGSCVEVKRGIALFFNCVFDGKDGAKSATGVKAIGLKSAVVCGKCRASGFSLSALHVEDGAFAWASGSVLGPNNRFGASSKESRLEVENCELRGNDVGVYFGRIASGGARGNVYAENKRDAQVVESATVEVDAPDAKKTEEKK